MGNDEHSQNVFRKARENGEDPLGYCDRMARGVPRRLAAARHLVRRLHPDDRAAAQGGRAGAGPADDGGGRHLRRVLRGLVLRLLRGVQAGEGSDRRHCARSTGRSRTGSARRTISSACRSTPQPLLEHFNAHPEFIVPDIRRNEILRLLEGGLEDISVSRAGQAWGIPMPDDPSSVIYVWVDALINYATAVGFGTDRRCSTSGGRPTCTSSARTSPASTA